MANEGGIADSFWRLGVFGASWDCIVDGANLGWAEVKAERIKVQNLDLEGLWTEKL